jgi:DNA-binding transcriptional regulator WhiA
MWYNLSAETNRTRGVLLLSAIDFHNISLWAKRPLCVDSRPAIRLSNDGKHIKGVLLMSDRDLAICEGYKSGKKLAELAGLHNLSQTTIYRILKANDVPTTKKTISYREDVFDQIDTELKAYVLGLITSDGYIVNRKRRYIVQLGSTDSEIPQFLADLIEYKGNIYLIDHNRTTKRNQDEYRIMVGSKRLVEALGKLGVVNRKSLREEFCNQIPDSLLRHYIRGLYDGDGSIGIYSSRGDRGQARIGLVGSRVMLERVSLEFTQHLEIPLGKARRKSGDLYMLSYSGNNLVKVITNWLYQDCNYALSRKQALAVQISDIQARQWVNCSYGRF